MILLYFKNVPMEHCTVLIIDDHKNPLNHKDPTGYNKIVLLM